MPVEWTMPCIASQLRSARRVFGLCGEIRAKRTHALDDESLAAGAASKRVHVNMAVLPACCRSAPLRSGPRPAGRRGLLHVGNMASYKRFDLLLRSLAGARGRSPRGLGVSQGRVVHHRRPRAGDVQVSCLGEVKNGDPAFEAFVRNRIDFYIHTSDMDARATVVLGAAARRIVPLVGERLSQPIRRDVDQ